MINREDILELLRADPFVPFEIQLTSGQGYRIEDPEGVSIPRNLVIREGEITRIISLDHIEELALIP